MSGHSKWATTRRQKASVDAKRGAKFTKLTRAIMVAARAGGDPEANSALRLAVTQARAASMPKDNIERAIQRGTGELAGATIEAVTYEGFGPGGVALIIETVTDNRNRTVAEVKTLLTRFGGSLGAPGSVSWMFEPHGVVELARPTGAIDELALIDLGAEDLEIQKESLVLVTAPDALGSVHSKADRAGWEVFSAALTYIPKTPTPVEDDRTGEKLTALVTALEDLDDVSNVYTSAASS